MSPNHEKTKKRGRGRPKGCRKNINLKRNNYRSNNEVVVIKSSPESCNGNNVTILSDSFNETKSLDTTANSLDSVIESVVAESKRLAQTRLLAVTKDVRVVLTRAEYVPGLMSPKNRACLSKLRSDHKKNIATIRKQKEIKREKAKEIPVIDIISISSSSLASDWSLYRTTPKKSKKKSSKSKKLTMIEEIKEENCETEIIIPNKKKTVTPLNFGEESIKLEKIEEVSFCSNAQSSASGCTPKTSKRKRSNSESKVHPFVIELNESGKNARSKKSVKRARKDNGEKKDKLCKQLENQTFINENFGLSKEPIVKRADDSKATKSDVVRGTKVTDIVDDSPSTKRIESARDIIGMGSEKKSIPSDICSLINGTADIVDMNDLPQFLECNVDMKMIQDLETDGNEVLTLFSASDLASDHALDKESCTLDSISQAIDKDVAEGNRLSPLPSNLLSFPSEREENGVEGIKHRLNGSSKSNESLHSLPSIGKLENSLINGTKIFENDSMRKRPAIMGDEILPEGSTINLQTIRDNRRRKKLSKIIAPPVSSVDNTLVTSVDKNRNVDVCEINTACDQKISIPETELEGLSSNDNSENNNNSAYIANNNNSPCAKDDFISEDVLNNNRETSVENENEINSEKQQNNATMYSAPTDNDVGTLKDHLDYMERFLQGGDSNILGNGKTDVEPQSEIVHLDECDIDRVLAEYTKHNDINLERVECLTNTENQKSESIGALTVQNLDAFNDCIANGKVTKTNRRETIGTEVCSLHTDVTGGTTESGKIRKRKWVTNGEALTLAPSQSSKITLNRRQSPKDNRDGSEKSVNRIVEIKEPNEKLLLFGEEKKNTESSVIDETVSVINEISRKLISPIMGGQECNNGMKLIESGVENSSLYNRTTSTPTKDGVAPIIDEDDSSSSSSSDSNSSSSSSSSEEDSSDESEDEVATNIIPINEKTNLSTGKNEESRQSDFEKRCSIPAQVSAENNIVPSFGANAHTLDAVVETAGSLIEDGKCPEDHEDDKSDCISLDTESLCMSRCASPDFEPVRQKVPVVSPEKQPKPSNIKSRLGPRVNSQTVANTSTATTTNNIIGIEATTNNVPNIQSEMTDGNNIKISINNNYAHINTCQEQAPSNLLQVHPEAAPEIEDIPILTCEDDVKMLLRGHCFAWMKNGTCRLAEQCPYFHRPQHSVIYHLGNAVNHTWIFHWAIRYQYRHFIAEIQNDMMRLMAPHEIVEFCFKLCRTGFLECIHFVNIVTALLERELAMVDVVELFISALRHHNDIELSKEILITFCESLKPGTRWEILKNMIMKFPTADLPLAVVVHVVDECVTIYPVKSHLDDVWKNLVSKLPKGTLGAQGEFLKPFYELRNATLMAEENALTMKTRDLICNVVSPESPKESDKDQDFPHAAQFDNHESAASPMSFVQAQASTSAANDSRAGSTSGENKSYCLNPIDQLPPAKSAYGQSIWKFHLDLQTVREALIHRDYNMVIEVLTRNQAHPDRLPHMAGFYGILCNEIMSSRHHLDEIIRRAVHSGASDELHRYIYDLGVNVLTTLADTGAWILAYGLLKTFKVYGQYNTCAYTLLSAEICIANHRPLKALAMLKQSGLVFSNQRRWNQMWCTEDEPLRISVMELLLISLCDGHAEYAFWLMDFILQEQCSNYKPINISRHVDRIAHSLLLENRTQAIVDLGRLIIESNLFVDSKIFRAMINRIFHSDQFLAKQLHRYATWLGAYNLPKISGITHMVINIDWTEEEMYLMFSSLIYELYLNIGHAIDRLRPRQLAVYLILEAMPTERQLSRDASEPPLSNAEINKRRALVKKICDRFDPKIKVLQKAQGKICKIRSETLVNYLKAGHFK